MLPSLLALIAFIIFGIILIVLFLEPIIVVGFNIVILYFLFLRVYTEITKRKRGELYLLSAGAAILIMMITGNFLPLLWTTTAALVMFAIAHVYLIFEK